MFVPENIAEEWQFHSSLHTFNPRIVRSLDLLDSTTDFLVHVGLPMDDGGWFPITQVYSDLPRLTDLVQPTDTTDDWGQLRVLSSYSVGIREMRVRRYDCVQEHSGRLISAG